MSHGAYASHGPGPVHEEDKGREELPDWQRAPAKYRERGEGEPPVARLRLFPTNIDGHEPGGRDGGRVGPVLHGQAHLPEVVERGGREEDERGNEDAVSAETRQDHEDSFEM